MINEIKSFEEREKELIDLAKKNNNTIIDNDSLKIFDKIKNSIVLQTP